MHRRWCTTTVVPMNTWDSETKTVKIEPGTYPAATSELRSTYITHPGNRSLHETQQVPVAKQMQDAFSKSTEAGSAGRRPSEQALVVDMKGLRVCESLKGRTSVATLKPEVQAALKAEIGDHEGELYLTGVHVEHNLNVSLSVIFKPQPVGVRDTTQAEDEEIPCWPTNSENEQWQDAETDFIASRADYTGSAQHQHHGESGAAARGESSVDEIVASIRKILCGATSLTNPFALGLVERAKANSGVATVDIVVRTHQTMARAKGERRAIVASQTAGCGKFNGTCKTGTAGGTALIYAIELTDIESRKQIDRLPSADMVDMVDGLCKQKRKRKQKQKMCEDCKKKQASCGAAGILTRRWCGGCSKKHDGAECKTKRSKRKR